MQLASPYSPIPCGSWILVEVEDVLHRRFWLRWSKCLRTRRMLLRYILPSSLQYTLQRKLAYSALYATFRKYPGALIKRDLSTGPGTPPLRFSILAFSRRFQAPWRLLLL
ncbi:hypothetical protein HPB49_010701 [Dermacentor silvarum]|uniref:Uncharacterized protein n=1 Tax=Dermacentor silvarum TaxID=543639 RepID=A0ACB8DIT3_DERSI|nr:hypothetical protein HPB49_010701 [Dermacentor silvarum]